MRMKDYARILKEANKSSLITLNREVLPCPNCNKTVTDDGSKYCWYCGVEIIEGEEVDYE